jgi:peptidoglycan hydrolase-like protein with peptidoglycan-binding domain
VTGRTLWGLVVVALLAAACDPSEGTTETTESTVVTTTTTTMPTTGRVPLQPNGPAFISEGDRGPYVEALQTYLVCAGIEQPEEGGPSVTIDGSYGPVTSLAVAYFQAQVRRVPTGSPDEETFAMLARECRQTRTAAIAPGASTMEIAGNTAPGDDEVFSFDGLAGQILRLTAIDGAVEITVEDAAGTVLAESGGTASVEIELATQAYTIRVSAASSTSFRILGETRSPNVLISDFGSMVLRHDGLGIPKTGLGDEAADAAAIIGLILLSPWGDSEWRSDVTECPGTHRVITWLVQAGPRDDRHPAVVTAYFAEVGGNQVFIEYTYSSLDVGSVDPLAQGLATTEGISIGSTLAEFVEAYGTPTFDAGGVVTLDNGLVMVFDLVGDAASPDQALSRVVLIRAGSGGCESL